MMTYVNTVLILVNMAMSWKAIRDAKWVANVIRTENYIRDTSNN